jgi:cysteine synthase
VSPRVSLVSVISLVAEQNQSMQWGWIATPTVRLRRFNPSGALWAKLEQRQPTGSLYDRVAELAVRNATTDGSGDHEALVVGGGGALCLSVAAIADRQGRSLRAFVPESTPFEFLALLRRHHVTIETVSDEEGVVGAIRRAKRSAVEQGGRNVSFEDVSLREALGASLGEELFHAFHDVSSLCVVAPLEPAGVLASVGAYLSSKGLTVRTVGTVRPMAERGAWQDGVIGEGQGSEHDTSEVVPVGANEAYLSRVRLAQSEGILTGLGSAGALTVADRLPTREPRVVLLLDAGDRYFSVDGQMARPAASEVNP